MKVQDIVSKFNYICEDQEIEIITITSWGQEMICTFGNAHNQTQEVISIRMGGDILSLEIENGIYID